MNEPLLTEPYSLEYFFELSADLLCIAGYDGYFKRISPSVSKVLGYTEKELFSRPIHEFIHPDDKEITARHRNNILLDVPLLNFENRYITKSGEIVWLSWTSMPLDKEQVVYAIAKNITHQKKSEADRNRLIADLSKINDDMKLLNMTASHDLRSPVSNLLSVFNLLDVTKITDQETLEFIEILKSATYDLKNTLNNYVDVLNQKDALSIHTEELYFSECLDPVLHSLNSLIKDSRATLNINFSEVEKVRFNRSYLESIFLNLITNSIKYARPELFPVISIYTMKENGVIQLIFSDKGQGFDMDRVKDKIFGLHQRFHDHADSKGIGLYLVYKHITSLGGKIEIQSKVNEGAKFTISFKA